MNTRKISDGIKNEHTQQKQHQRDVHSVAAASQTSTRRSLRCVEYVYWYLAWRPKLALASMPCHERLL